MYAWAFTLLRGFYKFQDTIIIIIFPPELLNTNRLDKEVATER